MLINDRPSWELGRLFEIENNLLFIYFVNMEKSIILCFLGIL